VYPLRRTGKTERLTLTTAGEQWLNDWMAENAFVAWMVHPEPWVVEQQMLKLASCPLNLADNEHHGFNATLRELRRAAVMQSKTLPVV
jgi:hypothetical protein